MVAPVRTPLGRALAGALAALVLAACGKANAPTPTPTPLAPADTASAPASPPGEGPVETLAPDERTVGQIADGIAAAWTGVTTYRATTVAKVMPAASPVAASPVPVASPGAEASRVDVDEVARPDRRRFTRTVGGQVEAEIVVVGGDVYVRGTNPPGIPPLPDPTQWRHIYPPTGDQAGDLSVYSGFTTPPGPPYRGLSEPERSRIARPVGQVQAGGRRCAAYRTVDTTQTGERIDIVIALDASGLPCSIETRAGGTVTTTTYEFGVPVTIEAPEVEQ